MDADLRHRVDKPVEGVNGVTSPIRHRQVVKYRAQLGQYPTHFENLVLEALTSEILISSSKMTFGFRYSAS